MNWELYKTIIKDVASKGISVLGLNRCGEPTLHHCLPELADYAKCKAFLLFHSPPTPRCSPRICAADC